MRVLLVCYGFPPAGGGGALRVAKFVKYANRAGVAVSILTVQPRFYCRTQDVIDETLETDVSGAQLMRTARIPLSWSELRALASGARRQAPDAHAAPGRVDVQKRPSVAQKVASALSFPDQEIGWLPFAVVGGLRLVAKSAPDVIYCTCPPATALLAGSLIARMTHRPLVVEFRDPWAASTVRPGGRSFKNRPIRRRLELALEDWVVGQAARTIVVNEETRSLYEGLYPTLRGGRLAVIPNGYDLEDFRDATSPRCQEKFRITFAGSFYGDHRPTTFIRGLEKFLASKECARGAIEFRIAGSLDRAARAEIAALQAKGLVQFLEHVDHLAAVRMLRESALLVLTLPRSEAAEFWIPAKTYEYIATDRPIIAVTPPGPLQRLLENLAGVTIVRPEDDGGVVNALAREYERWKSSTVPRICRDLSQVPTREEMAQRIIRTLWEARDPGIGK